MREQMKKLKSGPSTSEYSSFHGKNIAYCGNTCSQLYIVDFFLFSSLHVIVVMLSPLDISDIV